MRTTRAYAGIKRPGHKRSRDAKRKVKYQEARGADVRAQARALHVGITTTDLGHTLGGYLGLTTSLTDQSTPAPLDSDAGRDLGDSETSPAVSAWLDRGYRYLAGDETG
jgi:hypothetical protein